jgi:hypothetical protein
MNGVLKVTSIPAIFIAVGYHTDWPGAQSIKGLFTGNWFPYLDKTGFHSYCHSVGYKYNKMNRLFCISWILPMEIAFNSPKAGNPLRLSLFDGQMSTLGIS